MGRAPHRLDLVDRRAVADDRDDRPVRQRHPQPGHPGKREAEPALRGADVAERLACGQPVASSGRSTGASSCTTASRGSRSASAESTWPALSGSPGAGGAAAPGATSGSGGSPRARAADLRARGTPRRVAPERDVGGAAMQLFRVVGDDREPRPRLGQAAGRIAGLTETRGRRPRGSCRRGRAFAQGGPVRREGAQVQPVILRKAGAGTERLLEDRARPGARPARPGPPRTRVVRACADHDRGRRSRRPGRRRGRRPLREPPPPPGGRGRPPPPARAPRRRLVPVVHRNDHERRPAPGRGRVVGALDRGRDVLGARPAARTSPDSRRRARRASRRGTARRRGAGGPAGRRRTTSGARFTRAVASALTALPSPAVVCSRTSEGSPRPIAYPVAMPTTEPSCSPSTKREVVGQAREERRPRSSRGSRTSSSGRAGGRGRTLASRTFRLKGPCIPRPLASAVR